MEQLVMSVNSENTLIVGMDQYSPVAMIAEIGKYSSLSRELSEKEEHTVYFDSWRIQGENSAHRFVVASVKKGVSDKYGFYIVPKEDLPNEILELAEKIRKRNKH